MSDEPPLQTRQSTHTMTDEVPLDIISGWALLAAAFLAQTFVPDSPLRTVVAAPVLFFLPGYVTVALAFPHHGSVRESSYTTRIGLGERFALSFGLSLVILPILGLVAAALPGGLTPTILGGLLGAYVVLVGVLASFSRLRIPAGDRFQVPLVRWSKALRREFGRGTAAERIVTLALCLSVLLALGVTGYALAVPNHGETFTDVQLLTETDDGEYVAGDYDTDLTAGESTEYTVALENNERERTDYEVVVTLDRVVERDGDTQVIESNQLDRMDATVEPGERWTQTHEVTPELTGEDLRLTYYVYEGDAPERVDRESAYRHVHVWVDVQG